MVISKLDLKTEWLYQNFILEMNFSHSSKTIFLTQVSGTDFIVRLVRTFLKPYHSPVLTTEPTVLNITGILMYLPAKGW